MASCAIGIGLSPISGKLTEPRSSYTLKRKCGTVPGPARISIEFITNEDGTEA
jgi:hypothetical protein